MNKPNIKAPHNKLAGFFLLISCVMGIAIFTACPAGASAEDLEMINRPVNTAGLTGLLFTTTPFTLPPRSIEVGVGVLTEKSATPDYTITQFPVATITMGIAQNMELGLKGSYYEVTDIGGNKARGAGDTELSYKWNFWPQKEYSAVPGVALIVTGIAPTGNEDIIQNEITHWGARFGFAIGSEIVFGSYVVGIYGDAQMMIRDISDDQNRDSYAIANAGLLFPISKYRNLQMLIEYNAQNGKNKGTVEDGDYSAITSGLRLVSERFNLSIGTQFVHKKLTGYENSSRLIGMMSLKF